jgi:MutS-like protein
VTGAQELYTARTAERRATAEAAQQRARRLSNARLALFLAGVALAWPVFVMEALPALWLVAFGAGFLALVLAHERVRRNAERAARGAAYYERGLARLALAPAPWGNTGERHADPAHPYASQLDLFGPSSLFALLSQASTLAGEEKLASWLLAPAEPAEVRARQDAVRELAPNVALREDLFVLGADARANVHGEALAAWATAPNRLGGAALRAGLATLVAASAFALATAVVQDRAWWLALLLGGLQIAAALALRARVRAVLLAIAPRARDLAALSSLLGRVERERFAAPRLAELRAALDSRGSPPSRRIAGLHRLVSVLDWRRNQLFAPVAAFLLWGPQLALALEAWRVRHGASVAGWLDALGELEALCDLAGYAFEHPEDALPEIAEAGAVFDAAGLGHPLLDAARCVRNDLRLGADLALVVVSGSNMSGKSTFLRSVGTAAVMALAGAPVRAARLRVSPVALGAVLRVQDSLRDGESRFYAELLALRRVTEQCRGPRPVLFLLDEILSGTNSHDRRIGAAALLRALCARGAIGLVTTHDLALTAIADELAPRARNSHFEDELVDGVLRFDYRLRDGVIEHGNALELMRAVGLSLREDGS